MVIYLATLPIVVLANPIPNIPLKAIPIALGFIFLINISLIIVILTIVAYVKKYNGNPKNVASKWMVRLFNIYVVVYIVMIIYFNESIFIFLQFWERKNMLYLAPTFINPLLVAAILCYYLRATKTKVRVLIITSFIIFIQPFANSDFYIYYDNTLPGDLTTFNYIDKQYIRLSNDKTLFIKNGLKDGMPGTIYMGVLNKDVTTQHSNIYTLSIIFNGLNKSNCNKDKFFLKKFHNPFCAKNRIDSYSGVMLEDWSASPEVFVRAMKLKNRGWIKELLEQGADPNLHYPDSKNGVPLLSAIGDVSLFRLLLSYGADINVKLDNGNTLLHWVITNRNGQDMVKWVKFLIGNGADRNAINDDNEGVGQVIYKKMLGTYKNKREHLQIVRNYIKYYENR